MTSRHPETPFHGTPSCPFLEHPPGELIENAQVAVHAHVHGDRVLPIVVPVGRRRQAFVSSLVTSWFSYPMEEASLVASGVALAAIRASIGALQALAEAIDLDRCVFLNSWLLSTWCHADLDGAAMLSARDHAVRTFPDHLVCVRNLTREFDARMMEVLRQDGFILVPGRVLYVFEDVAAQYTPRRTVKYDRQALKALPHTVCADADIGPADHDRIVELYRDLYIGKHSHLNPKYTAAFIAAARRCNLLKLCGLRNPEGQLDGFAALAAPAGVMMGPLIGYDVHHPDGFDLYRAVLVLLLTTAVDGGLPVNLSAGAGKFKVNRGGRAVYEYTAFDARHLGKARRAAIESFLRIGERVAPPLLDRLPK